MNDINSLFKTKLSDYDYQWFCKGHIDNLTFYKVKNEIELSITFDSLLPLTTYNSIRQCFMDEFKCNFKYNIKYNTNNINISVYTLYYEKFINDNKLNILSNTVITINDNIINLNCYKIEIHELLNKELSNLINFNNLYSIKNDVRINLLEEVKKEEEVVYLKESEIIKAEPVGENKFVRRAPIAKKDSCTLLRIKDLYSKQDEPKNNIMFEASFFKIDTLKTKSGTFIQTLSAFDEDSAITCKRFENKRCSAEDMENTDTNTPYIIYGNYSLDNYTHKPTVIIDYIEPTEKVIEQPTDDAAVKRVEFHVHTNRSEMDAVSDTKKLVELAYNYGHKGIAITDHAGVQAFPKAQSALSSILYKNPDANFKICYGVEMNMVKDKLRIVEKPNDSNLDDVEYVVFDIETTGLSNKYDHIIEFAGFLVKNDRIEKRLDILIKPPIKIPEFIEKLTNIKNSDVENCPTFSDVKDEILEFIKGKVLVAHNGYFDYDFMNSELNRINEQPLTNPMIDTLAMAKTYLEKRKSYRLGKLASYYKIHYDDTLAHRADYDVEILCDVFKRLKADAKKNNVLTLNQLQDIQEDNAFEKDMRSHITVLAKNQKGLKNLFKLITISNTDNLAILGGGKSKEDLVVEPRIIRSNLIKYRDNLLFGSACYNGEVFETAANKSDEDLLKVIEFYDYIEIQPLENYRPLLERNTIVSKERLIEILNRIIKAAQTKNKLIIATGDVHYALEKDKIKRDVYINAKGIGGVRHPLYIYDETRRLNTINPDQHFRTTNDMLECFDWIKDQKLKEDIVINNTNKLLDEFEVVKPIHKDLYPPKIEGSAQKLTDECHRQAKIKYGENVPEIVLKRLDRELDSIIGNGFAVIYYISHLLVKRSNDDGYLVGSRGSVGSSLAATLSGITEVNPLPPHYLCPNCHHSIWIEDKSVISGYDLPEIACEKCNAKMKGEGQDIPFETFLGFKGDKVPDIDLNFSSEYQDKAHLFTKEVFGENNVFRAGTIGTVANKTAYGYILGYNESLQKENVPAAYNEYLASECEGVKRTTGQHPGGIIVIPNDMDVYDFTPVQYPANNPNSTWKTTHFDFHDIHDNVLKFDILGHVDPTVMRFLQNISNIDPLTIPMNDPKTMSIFNSIDALNIIDPSYHELTGGCGIPEFGTKFVRGILELTKPSKFSELVSISGLSHGTDVWNNNAKDLILANVAKLDEVIGCRDDIMVELIKYGLKEADSFTIMESVRKGKGLKPEWITLMKECNVPEWYIESCQKIKYMFPKAHAVAYVIMAIRVAWFKVYHPEYYYAAFLSKRCDAYEIETMITDASTILKRMNELEMKISSFKTTNKEDNIYSTLEICYEMYCRGYSIKNIDMEKSLAKDFIIDPDDNKCIIPPFIVIDGLGVNVANSIVEARNQQEFRSKKDIIERTQLSQTLFGKLSSLKCLDNYSEDDQIMLF